MAPGQRKVAFSNKQKKIQLQLKRESKRVGPVDEQERGNFINLILIDIDVIFKNFYPQQDQASSQR